MDGQRINQKRNERIYTFGVLCEMTAEFINTTILPHTVPEQIYTPISHALSILGVLAMLFLLVDNRSYRWVERIVLIAVFVLTVYNVRFVGFRTMVMFVFLYPSKDIDLQRVMRTLCAALTVLFTLIVVSAKLGLIEDLKYTVEEGRERMALGFYYPSHTSSAMLIVALMLCYVRKEKLTVWEVIALEAVNFWIYKECDARTGAALTALIPVVFYAQRFIKRKNLRRSPLALLGTVIFPLCTLVMLMLSLYYQPQGLTELADRLTNSRVSLGHSALQTYGLHPFGQIISWHGFGGVTDLAGANALTGSGAYNYVDSSLLRMLLVHGLVFSAVILFGWVMTGIYAARSNDPYLLWAMIFLAGYAMYEQWLMNIGMNPFLLFLTQPLFTMGRGGVLSKKALRKRESDSLTGTGELRIRPE